MRDVSSGATAELATSADSPGKPLQGKLEHGRRQWLIALGATSLAGWPLHPVLASSSLSAPASTPRAAAQADQERARRALRLLNRGGYGPRPGDLERLLHDGPAEWIRRQLAGTRAALPVALQNELETLTTPRLGISELTSAYQAALRDFAEKQRNPSAERTGRPIIREVAFESTRARLLRAIDSPNQLEEVMVDFWYNHFNVYIGKGLDRVLVGHYETHAIRPHVFGRFRDLLGATAKHPAMLFYLDNAQSTALGSPRRRAPDAAGMPNAVAAVAPDAPTGLNENYARELMELHTLGVDGGYTQRDVTELARMLTGWTFTRRDTTGDAFRFDANRHDTGVKHWLGQRVESNGQAEGESALDLLAAHPATARHIARKLARHFVSDTPSEAVVQALARRFLETAGDIRAVLVALFESEAFYDAGNVKFKTPMQYVLSAARAAGLTLPANLSPMGAALNQMGMPLYGCPTPDGYAVTESAWLSPDALTRRLNFATQLGLGRLRFQPGPAADSEPPELSWQALVTTLGPMIRPETRDIVAAGPAALRAALVLGSPDFMRT